MELRAEPEVHLQSSSLINYVICMYLGVSRVLTRHLGVRMVAARSDPRAGCLVPETQKSRRALGTKVRRVGVPEGGEKQVSVGPLGSSGSRLGRLSA